MSFNKIMKILSDIAEKWVGCLKRVQSSWERVCRKRSFKGVSETRTRPKSVNSSDEGSGCERSPTGLAHNLPDRKYVESKETDASPNKWLARLKKAIVHT